ncbi:hypothetical protein DYB38_005830 [Aphanomyces astaci]|uniref:Uncharacterized protein n=1 Tax=Aphanomyces astaci TaxID=112090 RepID=A0A397CTG9_APHAT|nr:hypothetical protein DYB38_005830 [Aphanomyces astaci]
MSAAWTVSCVGTDEFEAAVKRLAVDEFIVTAAQKTPCCGDGKKDSIVEPIWADMYNDQVKRGIYKDNACTAQEFNVDMAWIQQVFKEPSFADASRKHKFCNVNDRFMTLTEVIAMYKDEHTGDEPFDPQDVQVRIRPRKGPLGRNYNVPSVAEVAFCYQFESSTAGRDIVIMPRCGQLQRVSEVSSMYDPLQYPILFPLGESGWEMDMSQDPNDDSSKRMSIHQYSNYKLYQRMAFSPLHMAGKLGLQYWTDQFCRIETNRLPLPEFQSTVPLDRNPLVAQEMSHEHINRAKLQSIESQLQTATPEHRQSTHLSDADKAEMAQFSKFLLSLGNGTAPTINGQVQLPLGIAKRYTGQESLNDLIQTIYGDLTRNGFPQWHVADKQRYLAERALLAPTNAVVNKLNKAILKTLPGAKNGEVNGKRVYLIDEESTPADWDDMQSLSEYDRKEFCLSVMVFSSQEAKISNWKRGDIVKLVVKDLKLYDGKQCQALFLDVQSHRTQITMTIEHSDGQEHPDANTTTKQSYEQDCTDNSQDTASNSIQVKVEFPKVLGCEQGVKTPKKRLSSTDAKTYPATKKQTQAK